MIKKIFHIKIKAFSLVEILVVLGLFSSISTLVLGALFNAQAINGRLQETQAILDNVNLSTQTVTRDIRFGSDFYCATNVPTGAVTVPVTRKSCSYTDGVGGGVLIFRPADATTVNDRVVYYVTNGVLYKDEYRNGVASILQMTADDVVIETIKFYVDGAYTSDPLDTENEGGASDYKQPIVTLLISGIAKSSNSNRTPVSFSIQTHVSSRELDNK
jgi:type II secretory pathway pseudopilin PulG